MNMPTSKFIVLPKLRGGALLDPSSIPIEVSQVQNDLEPMRSSFYPWGFAAVCPVNPSTPTKKASGLPSPQQRPRRRLADPLRDSWHSKQASLEQV